MSASKEIKSGYAMPSADNRLGANTPAYPTDTATIGERQATLLEMGGRLFNNTAEISQRINNLNDLLCRLVAMPPMTNPLEEIGKSSESVSLEVRLANTIRLVGMTIDNLTSIENYLNERI